MNLPYSKISYPALALSLLMLATRSHHFGSAIALPDASLAVFFLAGLWAAQSKFFIFLLVEATCIDYAAITHIGVSSYCISPAYVFLIPTYGILWWAGQTAKKWPTFTTSDVLRKLAVLVVATTAAFAISNGSFYTLSGKFSDSSLAEYMARVSQYFLPYLTSTLIYCISIIAVIKLLSNFLPYKVNAINRFN